MDLGNALCGPRGLGGLVLGLNYSENPFLRQMQQPSLRRGGASASRKVEVVMQRGGNSLSTTAVFWPQLPNRGAV